jgi:hypothetical protein
MVWYRNNLPPTKLQSKDNVLVIPGQNFPLAYKFNINKYGLHHYSFNEGKVHNADTNKIDSALYKEALV